MVRNKFSHLCPLSFSRLPRATVTCTSNTREVLCMHWHRKICFLSSEGTASGKRFQRPMDDATKPVKYVLCPHIGMSRQYNISKTGTDARMRRKPHAWHCAAVAGLAADGWLANTRDVPGFLKEPTSPHQKFAFHDPARAFPYISAISIFRHYPLLYPDLHHSCGSNQPESSRLK
jgi:hypothetical protein